MQFLFATALVFFLEPPSNTNVVNKSIQNGELSIAVRQVTTGPSNHFFGYIGHVQNIPWNGNGQFILALRTNFQDRMPGPDDAADIVLIDTLNDYSIRKLDECRGWNPQQGTMFYWNPLAPDTQFFFNDRDQKTGKVFTVLFDISAGDAGRRIREYRDEKTPVANSGVAQNGGSFLAINYARMARLRPVTGYKDARDWTVDVAHPRNDGIFKINSTSGTRLLLVSFHKLATVLKTIKTAVEIPPLFINHTLWNRDDDRIFFFARGGWNGSGAKINQAFVMHSDGSHLTPLKQHIGGHPEWEFGHRMIGRVGSRQVIYDTDLHEIVGNIGNPDIIPFPEGDIALSPNGKWFVNGYQERRARKNRYVVLRRKDGAYVKTRGFEIGKWVSGDLRQDPSPCWNRESNQILVPALTGPTGSRQLFILDIHATSR